MTTHQLFIRHASALGIDSYNTFCKLLELLNRPARAQYQGVHTFAKWYTLTKGSVAECLLDACDIRHGAIQRRVALLDGTVIREWPIDDLDEIF